MSTKLNIKICQILFVTATVLLCGVDSKAADILLAIDSFTNYAAGNLSGQAFHGFGFASGGSWTGLDSSFTASAPNAAQINTNGLISAVVAVSGGKVSMQGDGSNLRGILDLSPTGPFANAGLLDLSSGTIGGGNVSNALYISFLLRAVSTNRNSEYGGLQLVRGDTASNGGLIGNSLSAWAYSIFDSASNTSVDLKNNNGTGGYYIMDNNTHLFVVKIQYQAGSLDTLTAWMDPIACLGETNQNNGYTYFGTLNGDYSFDRFFLRGGSSNPFDLDEIRFGSTWAAVLPPNPNFTLPASGPVVPELAPLEQIMTNVMANHFLHAGTIALMKNSLLVFRQGYGWRDTNLTQVIHPDNLCRLASVSKVITGSAIQKLVNAGMLSYSTSVYAYLGIQPFGGVLGDARITNITVQELVNHSGGWTGGGGGGECVFQTIPISQALGLNYPAAATNVISWQFAQPLNFTPGTSNVYSNFGYQILGRVIEKASGKRYIDYIQQDLLGLANITSVIGYTNVIQSRSRATDLAPWELWYVSPYVSNPSWGPSAVDFPTNISAQSECGGYGYYFEAFDSFGGISASAVGLCRYMQNYWMAGDQRYPGEYYTWGYSFGGALPGANTTMYQSINENPSATNGLEFAILFNGGVPVNGKAPVDEASSAIQSIVTNITSWPTNGGGEIGWEVVSTNILENAGSISVRLIRSGLSTLPVKISYTTYSITATVSNYSSSSGVVQFAAGETNKTIILQIFNTGSVKPSKQFSLELISASGGAWFGQNLTCVVNILGTNIPPYMITQPQNQSIPFSATAVFTTTAGGTPPLNFQWRKNASAISGATNTVLSLILAQPSDAGNYDLLINNSFGAVTSLVATLAVTGIPSTNCASCAPSGLISWWTGDGTANDRVGTIQGTVQLGVSYAPGKVNSAFSFNGGNGYVSTIGGGSLTGSFTVEFWAMPANSNAVLGLVGSRSSGDFSFDMKFQPGQIHGDIGNGTSWITTSANANYLFSSNSWYHIASVVTPTNYVIYINGVVAGSGSYSSNNPIFFDATHQLSLGYTGIGGEHMNGLIDEVSIYSRALSTSEIQAIYAAGTNGMCLPMPLMFTSPLSYNKSNGFVLNASLRSGQSYHFQANTNLTSINWISLTNFIAGTAPVFQYTNKAATNIPRQFYRIVSP